jgi:hypothetical protein
MCGGLYDSRDVLGVSVLAAQTRKPHVTLTNHCSFQVYHVPSAIAMELVETSTPRSCRVDKLHRNSLPPSHRLIACANPIVTHGSSPLHATELLLLLLVYLYPQLVTRSNGPVVLEVYQTTLCSNGQFSIHRRMALRAQRSHALLRLRPYIYHCRRDPT